MGRGAGVAGSAVKGRVLKVSPITVALAMMTAGREDARRLCPFMSSPFRSGAANRFLVDNRQITARVSEAFRLPHASQALSGRAHAVASTRNPDLLSDLSIPATRSTWLD